MVEGAPLLREYTGNGIEGSNPFFSAIPFLVQPGDIGDSLSLRHGRQSRAERIVDGLQYLAFVKTVMMAPANLGI